MELPTEEQLEQKKQERIERLNKEREKLAKGNNIFFNDAETLNKKGYMRADQRGQIIRITPKIRGKAARKADKRNRRNAPQIALEQIDNEVIE